MDSYLELLNILGNKNTIMEKYRLSLESTYFDTNLPNTENVVKIYPFFEGIQIFINTKNHTRSNHIIKLISNSANDNNINIYHVTSKFIIDNDYIPS